MSACPRCLLPEKHASPKECIDEMKSVAMWTHDYVQSLERRLDFAVAILEEILTASPSRIDEVARRGLRVAGGRER